MFVSIVHGYTICIGCRLSQRLQASTFQAPSEEVLHIEGVEEDLHKKCLQAAIDLQQQGWAVVEGILSQ